MLENQYESVVYVLKRKLACSAMRDTLRPRPISGQLRLPEAEAATDGRRAARMTLSF